MVPPHPTKLLILTRCQGRRGGRAAPLGPQLSSAVTYFITRLESSACLRAVLGIRFLGRCMEQVWANTHGLVALASKEKRAGLFVM